MADFTISLSKSLLKTIQQLGFDPESYIQTMLISPLMEQYRASLKEKYLLKHNQEIEQELSQALEEIRVKETKDLNIVTSP